ncbi:MAG: beta-lactamase family protein [Chloroflexi bacterium]|nr:beta-lactamase family protein [Chloroflexota bacterium]
MTQASSLPRSAPEARGIQSAAIHAFVDAVERDTHDLHSFMLLRHGHVVAEGWWEPYGPFSPHMLFSLSKSFTSTAIGLLVAEGRLSVDDSLLSFFPEEVPAEPSANLCAMRVRHLLSMSTGHAEDPTRAVFEQTATDWVRAFLAQPVEHAPGTHFAYNTAATYMLSAIVQRITRMRMRHYLQPRLFEPLGIENPTWETSPQGIDVGGSGLSVTTGALARFGQLYLQKGMWQGVRIVPEAWVEEATKRQVSNGSAPDSDWEQGYGYQFWRCRYGAYRGDGAFGQFCIVMPSQEAVLAITAGVGNMQAVLNLVWKHLLPAMDPATLPGDRAAQDALAGRLKGLHLLPPQGQPTSPIAITVSGKTFTVAKNDDELKAITFNFGEDGCILTIRNGQGEQRILCGSGVWVQGSAAIERALPWKVAASGAWTDEHTYVAQLWWYETPFGRTLTCRFGGDRLLLQQQANVSFGSTTRPTLEGRLV